MITIRFRFRFTASAILLALCMLIPSFHAPASGSSEFTVKRIGHIVSHTDNTFTITAPEEGVLSVTISDEYHVYRVFSQEIPAGESKIVWDGCSYNHEKLNTKTYAFDFLLSGKSGREYSLSVRYPLVNNAQYLQFALPSSNTVYLLSPEEWFLEAKAVLDGKLIIEFLGEKTETSFFSARKTIHKGRVEHYTFSQIFGKTQPEAGIYTVRVYEISKPDNACSFPLQILPGSAPVDEIAVSGNIMPTDDADDAALWQAMMEPAVVVDIDYLEHQNIYADQNEKSSVLGTLHGQTQCLSILEKNESWAKVGAWNHEDASYTEGWVPLDKLKVVYPSEEYGLLLDKKKQTLTVFHLGERVDTLLVSTGRMAENKYFRETSAGCFVTGLHRVDFSMEGSRYDFVIQYDGGNLLHQIPYSSDGNKDFSRGRPYLGSKASHACIRIQDEPSENAGINAYWIWTHIPYHTKLIILDDREDREKEMAVLSGNAPYSDNTGTICSGSLSSIVSGESSAVITFGGDVVPGDREGAQNAKNSFMKKIDQFGAAYVFTELADLFSEDDLTCLNLACVLKENGRNADPRKKTTFRGLPGYAGIFSGSSVELLNLVDDHMSDYKLAGYESTVSALADVNCLLEKDRTLSLEIKGCLFGFAACTEKEYIADYHIIERDIQKLKNEGCRYIIYQCSWGDEKGTRHSNLQNAMARACERAGADLVIGHHPGSPQGIDYINDMPVIYSLGKLVSGGSSAAKSYDALLVRAVFTVSDRKSAPDLYLIPVLCTSSAAEKMNDYKPVLAVDQDSIRILNTVQSDTPYRIPSSLIQ